MSKLNYFWKKRKLSLWMLLMRERRRNGWAEGERTSGEIDRINSYEALSSGPDTWWVVSRC